LCSWTNFRTSKHCHGCARELDTTTERCNKAVCPTCARGEEARKRFGKPKLDQASRAVRKLGEKKEAPVVVEVRADAQKLYEQNTSQAKAKAGAKVTSKARGLTKQRTIKLLCKLSGSVEGGKTRVLQGNNGGRLVHSIGTQISPARQTCSRTRSRSNASSRSSSCRPPTCDADFGALSPARRAATASRTSAGANLAGGRRR
jgi:hypothetical protein